MKFLRKIVISVAVVAIVAISASTVAHSAHSRTPPIADLHRDMQNAVLTDPDLTTQALTNAGYKPFGIGKVGSARFIYFGQSGANPEDGHGTTTKPWIKRQLDSTFDFAEPDTYNNFASNALAIAGDDWSREATAIRPGNRPEPYFACITEPSTLMTAIALQRLPATIGAREPATDFELTIDNVTFGCSWARG